MTDSPPPKCMWCQQTMESYEAGKSPRKCPTGINLFCATGIDLLVPAQVPTTAEEQKAERERVVAFMRGMAASEQMKGCSAAYGLLMVAKDIERGEHDKEAS